MAAWFLMTRLITVLQAITLQDTIPRVMRHLITLPDITAIILQRGYILADSAMATIGTGVGINLADPANSEKQSIINTGTASQITKSLYFFMKQGVWYENDYSDCSSCNCVGCVERLCVAS